MATYEVTLKDLRQAKACIAGYNKVVCSLQGQSITDKHRDMKSYIRFAYKEPISLSFILENNGLNDALWALRCIKDADRDIRLFSVWCARQVQHLMRDSRSTNALDVVERFANGKATKEELEAARDAASAAAGDAAGDAAREAACAVVSAASAGARSVAWAAAWAARDAACADASADASAAAWVARSVASAAASAVAWAGARSVAWAASAAASAAAWAARDAASADASADARAVRDDTYAAQEEMFKLMCDGKAPWQTQG